MLVSRLQQDTKSMHDLQTNARRPSLNEQFGGVLKHSQGGTNEKYKSGRRH
jgi:hypothetical protein